MDSPAADSATAVCLGLATFAFAFALALDNASLSLSDDRDSDWDDDDDSETHPKFGLLRALTARFILLPTLDPLRSEIPEEGPFEVFPPPPPAIIGVPPGSMGDDDVRDRARSDPIAPGADVDAPLVRRAADSAAVMAAADLLFPAFWEARDEKARYNSTSLDGEGEGDGKGKGKEEGEGSPLSANPPVVKEAVTVAVAVSVAFSA